jgi:hypothetical protein
MCACIKGLNFPQNPEISDPMGISSQNEKAAFWYLWFAILANFFIGYIFGYVVRVCWVEFPGGSYKKGSCPKHAFIGWSQMCVQHLEFVNIVII